MRSISWIGFSQLTSVVLQFAGSVVLARYLAPYEMGIYAVASAIVALLALMQAFGLQSFVVREEQLTDEVTASAFTINALTSIGLSLVTVVVSFIGGAALADDRVRHVLFALALTPLFGIFDFIPGAKLEREGRFKALALAGAGCSMASAVVTIVGAVAGASYMTAVYAGWASAATYAITLNVVGRKHISFAVGLSEWRRLTGFGAQMLATSGLHVFGIRVSDLCVSKLQGLSELGLYSRAANLNGLIWNNVHLAAGRVLFVDFSELHRNKVNLRDRYIATVDVITALLWPAFAGFAILSAPLIQTVYGHQWVAASLPMSLLSVSSIILVSITMTWEIFTATGNIRTQTRLEFINALSITALFAIGSYFSITAAAASRIVSSLIAVMLYRPHLSRMTNTRTGDFLGIYARNMVLTIIAVGPSTALMLYHGFSPDVPLLWVAATAIAGIALWMIGLAGTRHRLYLEFFKILGRRRSKAQLAVDAQVAPNRPFEVVD